MKNDIINKDLLQALTWAISELERLNDNTEQLEQISQQLPFAKEAIKEAIQQQGSNEISVSDLKEINKMTEILQKQKGNNLPEQQSDIDIERQELKDIERRQRALYEEFKSEQQGKELFEFVKASRGLPFEWPGNNTIVKHILWEGNCKIDGKPGIGKFYAHGNLKRFDYSTIIGSGTIDKHFFDDRIEWLKPIKINQQGNGSDAVEFAEWLRKEGYRYVSVNDGRHEGWLQGGMSVIYPSKDAYKLFKQSKL